MTTRRIVKQKPKSKHTLPKNSELKLNKNNLTHLWMHSKSLYSINKLPACKDLTVLYLHDNQISKIENLESLSNLSCLYLHHNKIKKIENLQSLTKLKKLYLGYNEINVVEGLENLKNLEELHIEKQYLTNGESMCFDPRSIENISSSLQYLNVSDNNITSLACLAPLRFLKTIHASNNKLHNIDDDLCDVIKNWYYLHEATFSGNPISKKHRYRETIIANTQRLAILDGKSISETTRCFITRMESNKQNLKQMSINLADRFSNLPRNYPTSLQKAASASILKGQMSDADISDVGTYIPWNSLVSSAPANFLKSSTKPKKQAASGVAKGPIIFNL